jgi:hypothetical protein
MEKQASGSFLKKRTKKLLPFWLRRRLGTVAKRIESFCFFFQKEALPCLLPP